MASLERSDENEAQALEGLMKEFFDGSTTNEKRQDIERLLTNFRQQRGCWKFCFNSLALTKCQYSAMFCLNTVEDIINKQWISLPWEEKCEIKSRMCAFVLENHEKLSPCLLSKSVKLVVDIARLDWPHFYPDFFTNIIQLSKNNDTRHLGLMYILITSEELITPREDLSFDRKNELKKLLLSQMPQVFSILFEFLTNDVILANARESCLILNILTVLFSWVPASQVPNDVIGIIFKLASNTKNESMAVLALGTINEMLYRHWLPRQSSQVKSLALELSQSLLNSSLDQLQEVYVEKFSEFLRLILPLQLAQPEDQQNSISEELFSAALNFTVRQPTLVPGFASCLRIWVHLLDNSNSTKFNDVLLSLVPEILNKIQFRVNARFLTVLDDETLDDDGETEWKKFIKPCIEIVAKVAEIEPSSILRSVYDKWLELCRTYAQILTNLSVQDFDNVVPVLRDLSTFNQIMGRFQNQCSGENWYEHSLFGLAKLTVDHLLTLNDLGITIEYHSMTPNMKSSFQKVHAEGLASLKSWCYWLPLLRTEDCTKPILNHFLVRIIDGCIPYLTVNSPRVLQHCSSLLLSTVTTLVRPGNLCELQSIKCLLVNRLSHLEIEDQYLIQTAVVNCLMLKWPNPENEMWEQRLTSLTTYIEEMTAPFVSLPLEFNIENKEVIISVLRMMQHIIKQYISEGIRVKMILCLALQKTAEHALALFPVYVSDIQIKEEILHFFFIVLECLQQQVGVDFTQIAISTFLNTYMSQQLQVSFIVRNDGGLQQLLQMLDLIVQTPGLSASKITPMAVDMCIQLFEPALTDTASPSIQESLFQLVHSILLHKWHYFFNANTDSDLRSKEFLEMMKAIGQSFFLSNIDLFRQNLLSIENMNNKWNLYRQDVFKKELHSQFLTALFSILIDKRHSLGSEEVANVICNLILVDTEYFYNDFLPKFLNGIDNVDPFQRVVLLSNFKKDQDIPSITQNIYRLANDLIYYRLCNSHALKGSEAM